jgi:hypothetical protein
MSKKWNVLIIVVFVMLLCSLSALLISNYMKNLITYSSEFNKYYKAYYLANSWIEISLTKIANHDFGFEDKISSWSDTINHNFDCWSKCFFETKISTRSKYVFDWDNNFIWQDCNDTNKYFQLWTGQWLIIPLFWDWNWNYENELSWNNANLNYFPNTEFNQVEINRNWNWLYSYWIFYFDNWEIKTEVNIWNSNSQNLSEFYNITTNWKKYLVIVNIDENNKQKICIKSADEKITGTKTLIQSNGRYLDRIVSLETLRINKLHDFIIYSINNYYN